MPAPPPVPDASAAHLTIDLDALAENYAAVRAQAAGAEVAPVVKADGYGLGAAPVARRLWAEGARSFYVARVAEGETLRTALGPQRDAAILVFDGCPPGAVGRLRAAGLTPVLSSAEQVAEWVASGGGGAALHVDTGMNRLGLNPQDLRSMRADPQRTRGLDIRLLLSHLACAGQPDHPENARQLAAFRDLRALLPDVRAGLCASAGAFLGPDYRFDQVRPGICLYGGGPFDSVDPRIRAVATLTAPVLQVRALEPGERVGYMGAFTAKRPTRLAILAGGYADGGLRAAGRGGYCVLGGALRPFVGRVSMDLTAVDVTDDPAVRVGDRAELLGHSLPL